MGAPRTAGAAAPREGPLGPPALRTFARMAELWGLSPEQQMRLLGLASRTTFYKWRKDPPARLSPDTLERLSYLFGIWKALEILLPDRDFRLAWIHRPNGNPLFGGAAPLERMLAGRVSDLYLVRRYLDGERGG
jgi:hypothetical protein